MDYLNRKLGLVENLFKILHDLGAMIDVNAVRIEGPLTPDILQQALDLVQKRHPMLQVHIVDSANGAYFQSEGRPKIPLRVIDKQHDNQWIEIAENELHHKFSDPLESLCRVTFLRSSRSNDCSEIIATFHHAITDGLSCLHFIDELLSYCQQIANGEHIPKVATMQLLPPLENLLDNSLSSLNVEDDQGNIEQEIPTPKLIIEGEAPASQRRTCLVPRSLSKEITLKLKERCKQEKTTIHGALCAAMLFGTAKIAFTSTPVYLSCGSNVNLRKYCVPEVKDKYMGCLVSALEEIHCLEKHIKFWDLARECRLKISQSIICRVPHSRISSEDSIKKFDQQFITQMSEYNMGRSSTTHISNRGQFNFLEEYGRFQIKELYFATGQHIIGTCFWLGVVTFHEQLFCSFAYVVPVVSAKTAELLVDSVIDTMHKACLSEVLTF